MLAGEFLQYHYRLASIIYQGIHTRSAPPRHRRKNAAHRFTSERASKSHARHTQEAFDFRPSFLWRKTA